MKPASVFRFSLLLLLCSVFGCGPSVGGPGKGTSTDDPEKKSIISLTQQLGDASNSAETFAALFVADGAPQDRMKDFNAYMFSAKPESITMEGDSAKMLVEVIDTSDQGTDVEWSFKKVDGQWKIAEAPFTGPAL